MTYLEDLVLRQLTRSDHYDEIIAAMRNQGATLTQTPSGGMSELDVSRILGRLGDINTSLERLTSNNEVNVSNASILLPRGATGQVIQVGTIPVKIIDGTNPTAYIILNPLGVTSPSTGTLVASGAVTANGDSTANPLGVGNYNDLHLYISLSNIDTTAVWQLIGLSKDPLTGSWFDSQVLVDDIGSIYTSSYSLYRYIGRFGVSSQFAVRWKKVSGTSFGFTFSIGYVLKDGQPGSATGLSSTVYLGNQNVNTNGFPLLEGVSKIFYPTDETDLYAVANTSTPINVYKF
jgi:hypothetical protein